MTGNQLDMNSFLQLLAAQFENQDPTNPTSNTEYISELAQFSSLQAMNTLTQYADEQYAASLVGKTVEVAKSDDKGNLVTKTGVVTSVNFSSSDGSKIVLDSDDNNPYTLSEIMQVIDPDSKTGKGSGSGSGSGDGSGTGSSTGTGGTTST